MLKSFLPKKQFTRFYLLCFPSIHRRFFLPQRVVHRTESALKATDRIPAIVPSKAQCSKRLRIQQCAFVFSDLRTPFKVSYTDKTIICDRMTLILVALLQKTLILKEKGLLFMCRPFKKSCFQNKYPVRESNPSLPRERGLS